MSSSKIARQITVCVKQTAWLADPIHLACAEILDEFGLLFFVYFFGADLFGVKLENYAKLELLHDDIQLYIDTQQSGC